jgi:hypothetical protein
MIIENVKTNNQWRDLISFYELPESEQKENEEYYSDSSFFKFKGTYWCMGECMIIGDGNNYWHGYIGYCNTTSICVHLSDCGEQVIVGFSGYEA